jgi:hypothetical protein
MYLNRDQLTNRSSWNIMQKLKFLFPAKAAEL